ncbi:MAG TPA: membrane protein insertion efficiency factor YidD [Treponema sp.]|nr:membrane protein insertion efficiency factor YidD [Treponema sp.]
MPKGWFITGLNSFFSKLFSSVIRFYQVFVSPLFPACCRYTPTCSQYALDAIRIHGAFKGSILSIRRILRCNPYHKGGYDPVPECKQTKTEKRNLPWIKTLFGQSFCHS